MSLLLDHSVEEVPGVGPARAAELHAAGILTVADLLTYLPLRYEDRSVQTPVNDRTNRLSGPMTIAPWQMEVSTMRRRRAAEEIRPGRRDVWQTDGTTALRVVGSRPLDH